MKADVARADAALWERMITALRSSRRWQFWIKVVLILGGATAGAIGGGMEGPLQPSTGAGIATLKGLLVCSGGAFAFTGGVLLLFVDEDVPALMTEARSLTMAAQAYLIERDVIVRRAETTTEAALQLDRKRRERLSAIGKMLEVTEAALLNDADAVVTAENLLRQSIHSIHKAVEYQGGDFLTVSIFRREDRGTVEGERLYRIAAQWSDPDRAAGGGRSWPRGQGYAGVAWARAVDNADARVIEPDTTLPHIPGEYPIVAPDAQRELLYRSVAAIPVLVGRGDDVWGVVIATSDRPGVFRHGESALGIQSVQLIEDVARFAGLLAGIDRVAHPAEVRRDPRARWFNWGN